MIRVADIAHVTYQAPDLDAMEAFLIDFGMTRSARAADALYMRGTGPAPYVHVSRRGADAGLLGVAFRAATADDLARLASVAGASPVHDIEAPGGGRRVTLTTPDGYRVDVVHGVGEMAPLPVRTALALNLALQKSRYNASQRPPRAPAQVVRLGHCVLRVASVPRAVAWFGETLGLIPADHLCVPGDPSHIVGTFLRCDGGERFVDHHAMLVVESDRRGVHHTAYEVQDFDALQTGHDWLGGRGYRLEAGVGRHMLGSQIFDYWRDPFGNLVEHYTDGDLVNQLHTPSVFPGSAVETTQWGMVPPPSFFE